MSSASNLVRLGGIAATLGGMLFAAKTYWDRNDAPPWSSDLTDMLAFVNPLLFLIGAWGLYTLCRGRLGRLGMMGFMISLAGFAVGTVGAIVVQFADAFWFVFVLGLLAGLIGFALAGIPILRAKLLGSWSILPLILGVYGPFALMTGDPPHSAFGRTTGLILWCLFGLLWTIMGYALLSAREGSPAPSRSATAVRDGAR